MSIFPRTVLGNKVVERASWPAATESKTTSQKVITTSTTVALISGAYFLMMKTMQFFLIYLKDT
jgi:predicted secreted protein